MATGGDIKRYYCLDSSGYGRVMLRADGVLPAEQMATKSSRSQEHPALMSCQII